MTQSPPAAPAAMKQLVAAKPEGNPVRITLRRLSPVIGPAGRPLQAEAPQRAHPVTRAAAVT